MVERRVGGETGVAAVTCLEGDAVWQAADAGELPVDLAEAALEHIPDKPEGGMRPQHAQPGALCRGISRWL